MHPQATDEKCAPASQSESAEDNNVAVGSAAGFLALQRLAEQGAIPLDQMARFLSRPEAATVGLLADLQDQGWIQQACLLGGQQPWVWLTSRGGRLTTSAYGEQRPALKWLAHFRAINEVRLHLEDRAPDGHWAGERELRRCLSPEDAIPDGLFEAGGERHAIEVELSRKIKSEVELSIASHSSRYDAVIYFCGPRTRTQLDGIHKGGSWPKLVVRSMPGPTALYTDRCRGFGIPLRDSRPELPPLDGRRRRGKRRTVVPWERRVLRLISEQGAMPLDLLSRFVGCEELDGERLARHLVVGRLATRGTLLAEERDWLWLNHRGSTASEAGLPPFLPRPGALAKLRALATIRLQVEAATPLASWTGRRALVRELSGVGKIPMAVVELDGERHAIEIELRKRTEEDALSILAHRSHHFDAVVCFCNDTSRRFYERLLAKNHLPKLLIQQLPATRSLPCLPASRWAASFDLERGELEASSPVKAPPRYRRKNSWQPDENPERSEVSNELWAKIKKLLPGDQRPHGIGSYARRTPDRAALSGVIYIARQGGNRKSLPTDLGYGEGGSCIRRLRSWEADGVWPTVRSLLEEELPDGDTIPWTSVARWR